MNSTSKSILVFLFIIVGCDDSNNTGTIDPIHLYPTHDISSLNDTLFLSTVYGFRIYNNQIYFSDYHNGRIISINSEDLTMSTIYGNIGRGPGEFTATRQFVIHSDTIIAIDEGGMRFHVFHVNGDYRRSFPFPEGILRLQHRFDIDNSGNIFTRTPYSRFPINVLNTDGMLNNQFGNFIPTDSEREKIARNFGHIIIDSSNNVICIYDSEPLIEFYSRNGSLLYQIDLSEYEFLQNRLTFIQEQYRKNPQTRVSTFHVLRDAYLFNNKLYILYVDHPPYKSHKIAVFDISDFNIQLEKILSLLTDSTENTIPHMYSFAVDNNRIIAYDAQTGSILVYDIPKL